MLYVKLCFLQVSLFNSSQIQVSNSFKDYLVGILHKFAYDVKLEKTEKLRSNFGDINLYTFCLGGTGWMAGLSSASVISQGNVWPLYPKVRHALRR